MPRFIIHDLVQAVAALRAAAEADIAVTLESAPGAARYLGAPYFLAMIEAARAEVPEARCDAVLDCADVPGLALDALRRGAGRVRLSAPPELFARVADIAAQSGATLETAPPGEPALDLGRGHDPLGAARRFLGLTDDPFGPSSRA